MTKPKTALFEPLRRLRDRTPLASCWLHGKTQHRYVVTGHCLLEATLAPAVLYAREDGPRDQVWARPGEEFLDGRFKRLA